VNVSGQGISRDGLAIALRLFTDNEDP